MPLVMHFITKVSWARLGVPYLLDFGIISPKPFTACCCPLCRLYIVDSSCTMTFQIPMGLSGLSVCLDFAVRGGGCEEGAKQRN